MTETTFSQSRVLVLEAGRAEQHYWHDIWAYRELFAILAWRDVAVRYKQTVIGVAWAVVRPFLTMVIFTVVFGRLARLPSAAVVALVDFAVNLAILGGLMLWYGYLPGWPILLLPGFVALAMLVSLGPSF